MPTPRSPAAKAGIQTPDQAQGSLRQTHSRRRPRTHRFDYGADDLLADQCLLMGQPCGARVAAGPRPLPAGRDLPEVVSAQGGRGRRGRAGVEPRSLPWVGACRTGKAPARACTTRQQGASPSKSRAPKPRRLGGKPARGPACARPGSGPTHPRLRRRAGCDGCAPCPTTRANRRTYS